MPLLFRTIKDKAVTEKDLDDIIKALRDAYVGKLKCKKK